MAMTPHPLELSFNPQGLNVLLLENSIISQIALTKMLQVFHYKVTPCTQPSEALRLIRNGEIRFDLVITEVYFAPEMNGVEFLEIVMHETDLPVVVISSVDNTQIMMEAVRKGACACLVKPIRLNVIESLWQHVARKEMHQMRHINNVEEVPEPNWSNSVEEKEHSGSSDGVASTKGKQRMVSGKKQRLVWTDELHQKFVNAVKEVGIKNAVPKRVLEIMNVPGLSRGNVSSHLQKYKMNLGKIAAFAAGATSSNRMVQTWTDTSMVEFNRVRVTKRRTGY